MPIVSAEVSTQHLATGVGDPNRLQVEYSTDILLPLPGPYLIGELRRDYLKALMKLNDFFLLSRDWISYKETGARVDLKLQTVAQVILK